MKLFIKTFILCSSFWFKLIFAQNGEFMLSPVPPHDTLYKLERVSANVYSFAGLVKTLNGTIVPTAVTLIEKDTYLEYSAVTTNVSNAFTITNIPEGKYILRGIPSYSNYTTTYFNNTEYPAEAYVFTINGNISGVQLFLKDATVTALSQDQHASLLSVYPNPFKDLLTINQASTSAVKIFDAYDHLVHKADDVQNSINTADWKPGIYFVRFEDGTVQKCIKE